MRQSIYIKLGDHYYWLAKVIFRNVRGEPGVIVNYGLGRIFREKGVYECHVTYPNNGSAHQSYYFSDKKKLMVFKDMFKVELPRDLSKVSLLEKQDMDVFSIITPPMLFPSHNMMEENSFFPLPLSAVPLDRVMDLPNQKESPASNDIICEFGNTVGTLNWSLAFIGDRINTQRWDAIFDKYYILGTVKPYVLVQISIQ